MQTLAILLLGSIALTAGCGSSGDGPTPAQLAHSEEHRQQTIRQLETMFGRPLTDEEKGCVVDRVVGGKIDSRIVPPLSATLDEWWHRRSQARPS